MNRLNRTILFVALSCILQINAIAQGEVIDKILAVVGDNIILKSDVEKQYLQLIAQGYDTYGDLKCEIFEDLLFQKLLVNQAYHDSIEVTDNDVDQRVNARLGMIINQAGSEAALEEYFNKSMPEIKADLRNLLREQLLTQKMREKITEDIKVTPSEVRKYYKQIPEDSLPLINAEMEIAQIVREPKITDTQIQEVKDKLNEYIERVKSGSKFSTLAIMYSEDPGSAKNGGELGYVSRNDLVPEFAAVAFNLKEKDEVSRIVESDFGFHVIQLIDRKGERISVRHILLSPKVDPMEKVKTMNFLDSIATLIRLDSLTFSEAARRFSSDEDSRLNGGLMINPNTGNARFEADEIDHYTYYAIKDMKIGEISKPIEIRD
ncbi:MAG: peptidylprolyl isomerase, partial [Bacteroidota bacterium]|nr:peptidylprolyl isomerase [Bacteroidota bacterium]